MAEGEFREASRVLTSVLSAAERKALTWMARRLPGRVTSDQLTLLGFASMLGAAGCFAAARWHPAALLGVPVLLALNWAGDSLDGTLARVRNQPRPRYGFYVDHVADAVGSAALLGGMALSGLVTPLVALLLLAAYLLVSVEVYLATYCLATFRLTYGGLGPTELRVIIAVGTLAAWRTPHATLLGRPWLLLDLGAAVALAGLTVVLLVSAARNTLALHRAEPLPRPAPGDCR